VAIISVAGIVTASDWPMFHHDLQHTGYSTSTAPNTNNVLWNFTTADMVYSSPAVVNSRLYVGTTDDNNDNVYCLDAADGSVIWSNLSGVKVNSSPAIADEKVYVGAYNGKVYCFNANNGYLIWSNVTGDIVHSSPTIYDGMVYVGSDDGKVYCFDAATGNLIWPYTTGSSVKSSPAVADGMVYVGSDKMYCLDAATGDEIWNYLCGTILYSSPTVVSGRVYVGSHDGNVSCLDAEGNQHGTTELYWSYQLNDTIYSSPAVGDDKVYIASCFKGVYCYGDDYITGDIDHDGDVDDEDQDALLDAYGSEPDDPNWNPEADLNDDDFVDLEDLALLLANFGNVYVASCEDKVYCLDADTGDLIWDYPTGDYVYSSPAVADGKLYISTYPNGRVICLNADNGNELWTYAGGIINGWGSPAVANGRLYIGLGTTMYCFEDIPDTNEPPRRPSQPIGQTDGTVNVEYTFATTTSDPEGDTIYYWFDWGDGTNSGWIVTSTASHAWSEDGSYIIKVKAKDNHEAKSGWSESLTTNIVEATQEEPKEQQFIFGTVLDIDAMPIEGAIVCAIIDDMTSKCKITDEKGVYYIAVSSGTFTISATKEGYEASESEIIVPPKSAVEQNFILPEVIQEQPEVTGDVNQQIMQAAVSAARNDDKLGAEIVLQETTEKITIYRDIDVEVLEKTKQTLSFKVSGEGSGAIFVISLHETRFSDITNIEVTYDGATIEMGNIADIFDLQGDAPTYGVLITQNEVGDQVLNVLLFVHHFSEHTITISSVVEAISILTAALLFISVTIAAILIFIVPVYHFYFRKVKE